MDYLSADDFCKVYGYACFYKADVAQVDSINEELFKEESGVCEAIIDLFRDEYDKGIAEAKELGIRENILSLFRKKLLSKENAAGELNITVGEFEEMLKEKETSENNVKSAG